MIITIDGPVASGKSTAGRLLAKRLGFFYLYSGALYRGLAYALINKKVKLLEQFDQVDQKDIAQLLDPRSFTYSYDEELGDRVYIDSQDVTPFLYDSFIDKAASLVSTNPIVRDALMNYQRRLALEKDVVVDGRDAGSVVFPEADIKFFITASTQERAERSRRKLLKQGRELSVEEALQLMEERDKRDEERMHAPLIIPMDAIVVDTTRLSASETLEQIFSYIAHVRALEREQKK